MLDDMDRVFDGCREKVQTSQHGLYQDVDLFYV